MPSVDPVTRFWVGIIVTVAIAISGGTLNLTHAIPQDYIPYVTAWCAIIAFVGSAVLTTLNGLATTNQSRLDSAAAVPLPQKLDALVANNPDVKTVVTTQKVADATTSGKIVSQ